MRIFLTILFIIDCIALCAIVLMQKGRESGIGGLTGGSSDTYWSKNKSRSREGMMLLLTRVFAVVGLVLVLLLNMSRLH